MFLRRPTNPPNLLLLSHPLAHPPTLPQCLPPPSSRPTGPWHRRVSPPPSHIWFSLGSPKMPLSEAPPTPIPGEVGRRIRGD